jgi:hypothetical protein
LPWTLLIQEALCPPFAVVTFRRTSTPTFVCFRALSLAWSADGRLLAAGEDQGAILLWNVAPADKK